MFHLALNPFGLGLLAGIGGTLLVRRSGGTLVGAAATVIGATTAVVEKGASLLGLRREEAAEPKTESEAPASNG